MLGFEADTMSSAVTAAWLKNTKKKCFPAWTRSLGINGDVWLWDSQCRMGRTQKKWRQDAYYR